MLATLLPAAVAAVTHASGGGISQVQVAFVLSGGAALIVDRCHLAAARRTDHDATAAAAHRPPARARTGAPTRVAGLAAAGCAMPLALLIPLTGGHVARAATTAALACGLLAAGLLAPALPHAPDGVRTVAWRLLATSTVVAVLVQPVLALALLVAAAGWWTAAAHGRPGGADPTAADVAAPVVLLSPLPAETTAQRRRLAAYRFGVVSRGCEHRLVDAASPRVAALPADHRVDWWRVSETVPVVNGAVAFRLIAPALERHARLLVQVGDAITGVLDNELVAAGSTHPSAGAAARMPGSRSTTREEAR